MSQQRRLFDETRAEPSGFKPQPGPSGTGGPEFTSELAHIFMSDENLDSQDSTTPPPTNPLYEVPPGETSLADFMAPFISEEIRKHLGQIIDGNN